MKKRLVSFIGLILVSVLYLNLKIQAQTGNWTQFRGSNGDGISEGIQKIPLKWDQSAIKWQINIHNKGYSSPVVYGDQIWVTTAKEDGKELYAVCIDFATGRIIHDIKVFSPSEVQGKHQLNTYATPTPCIESGFVYVHFGSMGTACLSTSDGKVVWKREDLKCKHIQGPASSPILYKNLLILHFEGVDVRYIIALDKTSGQTVWRTDRPAEPYASLPEIGKKAYITPIIINVKGHDMLISNGSAVCQALDPETGKEIWRVTGGAESTVAMPFYENGILYWYKGYMEAPDGSKYTELIAVNPDGKGDITATNVIWKMKDALAQNHALSPVIRNGLIYTVNTHNMMMCIDAATGKQVWSQHLKSSFHASPVYANDNVWFFSVKGEAVAIKAGPEYKVVAQNQLDSGMWATPAFLRNSVIVRTEKSLYRIGQ